MDSMGYRPTGKKFADHNIFRLDFRNSNLKQIWEKFEDKKLKCLAVHQ